MQLRNLSIPTGAVFAPMAGLTDAACRHLMADHGAAWTVSEMASAKALNFHDEKSLALLRDKHLHGLYAIQLFGAEPESMAKAILFVREQGIQFDILDINMGCPAPKITGSGAGSRLLLDPPLCGQMVAAARKALGDDTPLTVKMRIGWDADHLTGVEVAKQLEANGADLIAVHGRTREQMYIPPIDTAAIAAIKQAVSVPVLANGDVTTADEALTLLEATGCDGVMIGRGALGDPWLFAQVRAALLGEERPPEPTLNQRMTALRDQIYEMCEEKGEWAAMPQARSQAMQPTNVWIGVADAQGVVRNATNGLLVGQSVAQRPWFQHGLQGVHVGDVHAAQLLESLLPPTATGEPHRFVDFAAPIRIGPTTVGVFAIHGSWQWTREVLESLTPASSDESALELFIFDRQGTLIFAPGGRTEVMRAAGQRLPEGIQINNNRDGGGSMQTTVARWQDGKRYLTAATQLQPRNAASDLGWRIVARQPV